MSSKKVFQSSSFILGYIAVSFFLFIRTGDASPVSVCLKGLVSLAFVVNGLYAFLCCPSKRPYASLTLAGLTVSLIGDLLLEINLIIPTYKDLTYVSGILCFMAGHLLYLTSIIPLTKKSYYPLSFGVICGSVFLITILQFVSAPASIVAAGSVYVLLIFIISAISLKLLLSKSTDTEIILYSAGAILYTVSDVFLIINTFGPVHFYIFDIITMTLYYTGQQLIALSLYDCTKTIIKRAA